MKDYFLFPKEGVQIKVSEFDGQLRIQLTPPGQLKIQEEKGKLVIKLEENSAIFEKNNIIKDLRDLANYIEKWFEEKK